MLIKTARFNLCFCYKTIRLALEDGESLSGRRSWRTDEGYSYESFTVRRDGDMILLDRESGGRDCDGEIGYYDSFRCHVLDLAKCVTDLGKFPNWRRTQGSQYDQFAEAAGY